MFNKKLKELEKIIERAEELLKETSNVLSNEYIRKEDIVECDNCGCLIWKNKATQKKHKK